MPSVIVAWKGSCRETRTRTRLLSHLHRLASASDHYFRSRQLERPAYLKAMNDQRERGLPARANIETLDRTIERTVLISSRITPNNGALISSAREAGLAVIERKDGRHAPLIAIDTGRLRGLDFRLFDPRGIYPGQDRMSFVFLECPEHPFLDGRLVEVTHVENCPIADGESLPAAAAYLVSPSIHLRYYLEDWTDCLFSWIKFFLIGDFWWHRWEEMQGYADYRGVFQELQTERGSEDAEGAAFDAVLGTFAQHAEHWIAEVEGWAKSEQN